jgi:hypothetical protein
LENRVRDKILITLVVLIIILNLGHTADHFARGDFRWPVTVESVPPIIVTLAVNAILGFGLYFTVKTSSGLCSGRSPRALAWHSAGWPISVRSRYIYHAYATPAAGWLAVAWLAALMLALIVTAIYAEYLWART